MINGGDKRCKNLPVGGHDETRSAKATLSSMMLNQFFLPKKISLSSHHELLEIPAEDGGHPWCFQDARWWIYPNHHRTPETPNTENIKPFYFQNNQMGRVRNAVTSFFAWPMTRTENYGHNGLLSSFDMALILFRSTPHHYTI